MNSAHVDFIAQTWCLQVHAKYWEKTEIRLTELVTRLITSIFLSGIPILCKFPRGLHRTLLFQNPVNLYSILYHLYIISSVLPIVFIFLRALWYLMSFNTNFLQSSVHTGISAFILHPLFVCVKKKGNLDTPRRLWYLKETWLFFFFKAYPFQSCTYGFLQSCLIFFQRLLKKRFSVKYFKSFKEWLTCSSSKYEFQF